MASVVSIAKIYIALANAKKPHSDAYLPEKGGMGFQAMWNYLTKRNCADLTESHRDEVVRLVNIQVSNGLMYRIGKCTNPLKFRGRIGFTPLG